MIPHQMTIGELEILLNPSVKGKDELRLSRQAEKIYELLQRGPVKTSELAAVACQYNARVSEIRHAIVKMGLMVDEIDGEGGENQYQLTELQQSTFWKKVKAKNEEWKWQRALN